MDQFAFSGFSASNMLACVVDGTDIYQTDYAGNRQMVEDIYRKYGSTMQGRAVCGLLGTTPEALKADAERMLGGSSAPFQPPQNARQGTSRFPRLK